MFDKSLIVAVILFFVIAGCENEPQTVRTVINFNTNWTFDYLPEKEISDELVTNGRNDSICTVVGLPHTWQTYETTGDLHPFIKNPSERDDPYWWKGWGYYTKRFVVSEKFNGNKVTIEFDGVQKYSRVYLNGNYVGGHKGGYTSFYFDLTPFVKFGEENVLVVAVNNRRDDKYRIPPMTAGNWDLYGGIYRDVRLVIKNKVHIPYQGSYKHEGGTFITTPVVNRDSAVVNIKTYIQNDTPEDKVARLITSIVSPTGETLDSMQSSMNIKAGKMALIEQRSYRIKDPLLWHPDTPNMYGVKSEVFVDGKLVDVLENPLGFRWFRWDYESNDLYVNDKKIHIKGFNRHQEYPWIGDAIPKWITLQDFSDMKEKLGINFFRAAHYPNDPYVYHLADSLGMIAVEEVPNIKSIDFDEEVQKQNVIEMIRRDRNHPSIFFWSVGNETSDAADSRWVMDEDTTRIIHARKAEDTGDYVDHDHTNLDMENLLRVTVRGYFDEENSRTGYNLTPGDGQWCSTEEWQHDCAMKEGGSVRGSLKKNTVLWLYEDHGADREYKNSPLKHVNYKGWVDMYRIPKYVYYITQAMYTDNPMVFVHPHYWTPKYLGQKKDFVVNSNCEKVELYVDNKKIGEAYPKYDHYCTVTFKNIEVTNGNLKVIGVQDGKKTEHKVAMSDKPAGLKLTVSHDKIPAGKGSVAIVTADIIDENGNRVVNAKNSLEWEVTGSATLVGPKYYESDFNLYESMEGTGYVRTPVSNVIRSGNQAGTAIIKVSSPGLRSDSVIVEILNPQVSNQEVDQLVLSDRGRRIVKRKYNNHSSYVKKKELKLISGNVKFDIGDKTKLQHSVTNFLCKGNPHFDKDYQESKILIEYLMNYLINMQGELIGDDFNFFVEKYNDCRSITEKIEACDFPYDISFGLKKEYAVKMIKNNEHIDLGKELGYLENLTNERMDLIWFDKPEKGNPYISENNIGQARQCYCTDIEDLVLLAYPEYQSLSITDKTEYLSLLDKINPYVVLEDNKATNFMDGKFICLINPEKLF